MDVHGGPGARFDDVLAFEAVADSAGHPPEERQTLPCPVVGGMRVLVDSRAPVQRADLRPPGDGLPPSPRASGREPPGPCRHFDASAGPARSSPRARPFLVV